MAKLQAKDYSIYNDLSNTCFNLWNTIDYWDKARLEQNKPYRQDNLRYLIGKLQSISQVLRKLQIIKYSDDLITINQTIFENGFSEKPDDLKVILAVNHAKDIIHRIKDHKIPDFYSKIDTSLKGFPLMDKEKKYILTTEARILWLLTVIHSKLGDDYYNAVSTIFHDQSECMGDIAHTAETIMEKIVEKKIKKKEAIGLLLKIIQAFQLMYYRPNENSDPKLQKLLKELDDE